MNRGQQSGHFGVTGRRGGGLDGLWRAGPQAKSAIRGVERVLVLGKDQLKVSLRGFEHAPLVLVACKPLGSVAWQIGFGDLYQAEGIVIAQALEQGWRRLDHQEPLPFLHVVAVHPLAAFRVQDLILGGRARPESLLEDLQRIVRDVRRRILLRCRGGRLVNVLHPRHKGYPPCIIPSPAEPAEPAERHDCEGDEK